MCWPVVGVEPGPGPGEDKPPLLGPPCWPLSTALASAPLSTTAGPRDEVVGFSGGNVRNMSLHDIWHYSEGIHFGRLRSVDDLWGYCRGCYYNDVCRGGCTWTSHSLLGRPGNNPYCHYRALDLQKCGLRERIVKL